MLWCLHAANEWHSCPRGLLPGASALAAMPYASGSLDAAFWHYQIVWYLHLLLWYAIAGVCPSIRVQAACV
jgi:hypothetical protein